LSALSGIYGRVVRARRAWYQPHRQRRLRQPVVSVGNLVMGGSGKTPVVAALTRLLQDLGEKPVILSRGYGRRSDTSMVVVSEGRGPIVDVNDSGDEPQMLARALPGTPIIVSADRHKAGSWAEDHLSASIHVLDDGFQHLKLARDVDMLLVSPADLAERVVPAGRLREPVESASAADVVLVPGSDADRARVQSALKVQTAFSVVASSGALCLVHPFGAPCDVKSRRVVAVAAIARPERFFESLSASEFDVADTLSFRDHHWFDEKDVLRIEDMARTAGVGTIVTTEKDAVRLEGLVAARARRPETLSWTFQPYIVRIEPEGPFRAWLTERLRGARQRNAGRSA